MDLWLQRIVNPEVTEAGEIAIAGAESGAVLDGQCGHVRVRPSEGILGISPQAMRRVWLSCAHAGPRRRTMRAKYKSPAAPTTAREAGSAQLS